LAMHDLCVAEGDIKLQGINYYDGKSNYHRTKSPFTVPYCGSDSSTNTAQLTLTCAAQDYGHNPVGFPSATGSCALWTSYIDYGDQYDATCSSVDPTPLPVILGTWNARCDLPKECVPEHGYGGYEHQESNTEIRIEGEMWYTEDAYVTDLSCFENSDGEDYGLIYQCIDCPLRRKSGKPARSTTHKHAKHGRSGNNTPTGKAPATKPGTKNTAKITYDRDEDATYYKLEYLYLLAGSMTQYNKKHGEVKYVGQAQIVQDLLYAREGGNPVAVTASSLPSTAVVVDCTNAHFNWLDTREQY